MSNLVKIFLGALVLCCVLSVGFVVYTAPHWWRWVGNAKVAFVDGSSGIAKIYKSKNGEFLFSIGDQPGEIYIYYPSTRLIGIPNGTQFSFIPFFAYSNDVPVPVVLSDNKIKVETKMDIVIENATLKFTTFSGDRVETDLSTF